MNLEKHQTFFNESYHQILFEKYVAFALTFEIYSRLVGLHSKTTSTLFFSFKFFLKNSFEISKIGTYLTLSEDLIRKKHPQNIFKHHHLFVKQWLTQLC